MASASVVLEYTTGACVIDYRRDGAALGDGSSAESVFLEYFSASATARLR